MDQASEYNVVGSLLGLEEYIFLEILSEMTHFGDVRQFLAICKKIFELLNHPRFVKIIQSISIGVVDASCSFAADNAPWEDGNSENTVRYWIDGSIDHITSLTIRNGRYKDGQRISAIVDMTSNPRKVIFYVDNIEQPNYVIGIPSEIRFWVRLRIQSFFFLYSGKVRKISLIYSIRC
ncbi:MAG: hypothetical protein EZS28_020952 [Streblomastix strix]|uniref:Uncharacterized protein n=1 Tax=Streblomastix strix TaxID=222440 RepID=A0A5J4VM35_9EUKA|nr:MAG: hypothetical protein EZS28_020952 [Streblomastix strix]